jgi:enterochelin esterase-like enzyme
MNVDKLDNKDPTERSSAIRWILVLSVISAVSGTLAVLSWPSPGDRTNGSKWDPMSPPVIPTPSTGTTMIRPETLEQGIALVVRDASGMAGPNLPIYLASNRNDWNPADPGSRLELQDDGRWRIDLPFVSGLGDLEFKFTLGTWSRCEVDASGFSIKNRYLPLVDAASFVTPRKEVFELEVARFLGEFDTENLGRGWTPRVADGRIQHIRVKGGGGRAASLERDIFVWLPLGYDDPANASRSYPALVMLDGQNLFEANAACMTEWQADETASRLLREGVIEPIVIVGIPHAGSLRFDEYWPYGTGDGLTNAQGPYRQSLRETVPDIEGFTTWVADVVLPVVRASVRIETEPSRVGVGGGSVAACAAYWLASRRPEVFGSCLIESMELPWTGDGYEPMSAQRLFGGHPAPRRLFVGFGDLVGAGDTIVGTKSPEWMDSMIGEGSTLMALTERKPDAIKPLLLRGTEDSELGWSKRFPLALEQMFPARR